MKILGISGGFHEEYKTHSISGNIMAHDSAAALLIDGKIVSAIEEERLNRIKHTDKLPIKSMKFCLDSQDIEIKDIDKIAILGTEDFLNSQLRQYYFESQRQDTLVDIRSKIKSFIYDEFKYKISDDKLFFCNHHIAHAMSVYGMSGFDDSLILTIDGSGDNISGMILKGSGDNIDMLKTIPLCNSLGWYYLEVISYLNFGEFEEYKVMGLAPYGNPKKYSRIFKKFYTLLPNGEYKINTQNIDPLLSSLNLPYEKDKEIDQIYMDIAASLQNSLVDIVLHILKHYGKVTESTNLCIAGGVAHNCAMNGKILYTELFKNIFVQPASHDAGNALGVALYAYKKNNQTLLKKQLEHVYLGSTIGDDEEVLNELIQWKDYIDFEMCDSITKNTASLIASGNVVGWVQGRAEFGPRALGNRSILADPRPLKNKDIINAMVKKREAFRPFAPSIIEESVSDFYDIPQRITKLPFMVFVVNCREEKREQLGAVTHIDGTARIQSVSRSSNPLYWDLINEFGKISGVPVLLNTSFNNNVEPIVESVENSIVSFLTTELDYLIVGNYIIKKKNLEKNDYLNLIPSLPIHVILQKQKKYLAYDSNLNSDYRILRNYNSHYSEGLTKEMYYLLENIDNKSTFIELIQSAEISEKSSITNLAIEIFSLWSSRFLVLKPKG
ncbi:MAG: nodulation protein [bacterium]|nr:nodulation protein [bacterium]